jgi:hypothetical protein
MFMCTVFCNTLALIQTFFHSQLKIGDKVEAMNENHEIVFTKFVGKLFYHLLLSESRAKFGILIFTRV